MTRYPKARLSRRGFLGNAVLAASLMATPHRVVAAALQDPAFVALAFDGDTLIAAGRRMIRLGATGNAPHPVPIPLDGQVRALATHPARPGLVVAVVAGAGPDGLGRSDDGGRTWVTITKGLPDRPVTALTIAAENPDTFYAAVAGDGIWRSEDAGASWAFAMDRPWLNEAEREVLTIASVNLASGMGGIWIYAGTDVGLTRVPDCFCRWQDVTPSDAMDALVSGAAPPSEAPLPPGEMVRALVSAPAVPGRLHAALGSGIWASTDGGLIWARQSAMQALALAVYPTDPDHIVAAISGGLMQSRDGGTTWAALAVL